MNTENISYNPHTADIRMKVTADSPEKLFMEAVRGMGNLIRKNFCESRQQGALKKFIYAHSVDRTALLIDFLSDILAHGYSEHIVFCEAEIKKLTEHEIEAVVSGNPVDFFDEDIKAVTYHEAEIIKNNKGQWETTIIFDI